MSTQPPPQQPSYPPQQQYPGQQPPYYGGHPQPGQPPYYGGGHPQPGQPFYAAAPPRKPGTSVGKVVLGVFGAFVMCGVAATAMKDKNSSSSLGATASSSSNNAPSEQPARDAETEKPFTLEECKAGLSKAKSLTKDRIDVDVEKVCANAGTFKSDVVAEHRCLGAATALGDLARCGESFAKLVWQIDPAALPDGVLTRLMFGKSTVKANMGITTVFVEAHNPTTSSLSCTVSATFKKGDDILGVANGAVNDVPSKGKRTAQLMTTDSVKGYDKLKVQAEACFAGEEVATAVGADGASDSRMSFGKPTIKTQMGMTTVMVEARNTTTDSLSCTVSATFKKGGSILTTANGAVNDVPSGSKRTAQLMTTDPIKGYDELILTPDACF